MTTRENANTEKDETKEELNNPPTFLDEEAPKEVDTTDELKVDSESATQEASSPVEEPAVQAVAAPESDQDKPELASEGSPEAAPEPELQPTPEAEPEESPLSKEAMDSENSSSEAEGEEAVEASFSSMGLQESLIESVNKLGWSKPTPIQSLCLPHSLKGKDVAGFAQTGTGKTGAFLLTLGQICLKKIKADQKQGYPIAVVLSPTRELAMQIEEECRTLLGGLGIKSAAIFGGTNWEGQAKQLKKEVHIIIATPGRLKDYYDKKLISLNQVSMFICDEADRMFDMGFIDDVEFFLSKIDDDAQKLVFSATTNARDKELVFKYLNNPEYLSVSPEEITPDRISQHALICETQHKFKLLLWLLTTHAPERAMIFTNTKLTAQWLHYKLSGNGIDVDLITGDLPQSKRIRLIKNIKEGKTKILIATDVASRGLHISGVTHVYNFDIPDEAANYVHRIGRTARAGAKGASYSLLCDEYSRNFLAVQGILGKSCPEASWPEEAFLSVEDKAGNPFEDENSVFARDSRERGGRGKFDRSDRSDRRDRDDRNKKRFSDNKGRGRDRDRDRDKDRDRGRDKDRDRNRDYDRSRQSGKDRYGQSKYRKGGYNKDREYNKDRSRQKHKKHTIQKTKVDKKPAKQRWSLFGVIKRFFTLLFKRKKKKKKK